MSKQKLQYQSCTICEALCGIVIATKGEQIVSIKGDADDPLSKGHICPKAMALKDIHEDPDRLRGPIARTADGWEPISWDDALDRTADGLKKIQREYGRDAVATYLGNPNVHNTGAMLMGRFFYRALGTRNKYSATSVDQLPHQIVAQHLYGHQLKLPVPDIDRSSHFLILGANPLASNGSMMTSPDFKRRLKRIQSEGGRVVVIDPRKTETAALADEHHFIRPGSDVLLLLAMINYLYAEELVQVGVASSYVPGLEEIQALVAPYSVDRVAAVTGISVEQITKIVRDFCAADRPVCYGRLGVSVQSFGLLCQYLIQLFNILTGRLDAEGGLMFTSPAVDLVSQTSPGGFGKQKSRVRGLPSFAGEYPVSALAEEILTPADGDRPSIKGLVCVAGNPVLSTPNGGQLDRAFEELEFMVAIDCYRNESNSHADLILPPVGPLERMHYDLIFHMLAVRNTAKYSPPLFVQPQGTMQDWQIFLELAARLQPERGFKDKAIFALLRSKGPEIMLRYLLMSGPYGGISLFSKISLSRLKKSPHGMDLGPLRPSLPATLVHRDKKVHLELDFYFSDLKRVEEHFFGTEHKTQQMLLIGRRHIRSNNSWLHNSARLVKGKPRCTAEINTQDADRMGLQDGDRVRVSSRVGSVELESRVTDGIMPGVVSIPHGWGHGRKGTGQTIAALHSGVSVNDLTDEMDLDFLSGNAVLNGVPVAVDKA